MFVFGPNCLSRLRFRFMESSARDACGIAARAPKRATVSVRRLLVHAHPRGSPSVVSSLELGRRLWLHSSGLRANRVTGYAFSFINLGDSCLHASLMNTMPQV